MLDASSPAPEISRLMVALAVASVQAKLQAISSGIPLGPPYEFPPVHRYIIAPFGTIAMLEFVLLANYGRTLINLRRSKLLLWNLCILHTRGVT